MSQTDVTMHSVFGPVTLIVHGSSMWLNELTLPERVVGMHDTPQRMLTLTRLLDSVLLDASGTLWTLKYSVHKGSGFGMFTLEAF